MINFYDTNALLHTLNFKDMEKFFISNLTFKELQQIKTNNKKDPEIKYKARKLINWLMENKDKYEVVIYNYDWEQELKINPILTDNVDSRIILSAFHTKQNYDNFITYDSNLYFIATSIGIPTQYPIIKDDIYTGYKTIISPSENELIDFYSSFNNLQKNYYNLLANQYLIIKDNNDNLIDTRKYLGYKKGYCDIKEYSFNSKFLGKTKAKDAYQKLAIDSLLTNKITVLRGKAGTGKSLLALSFLFEKLEKGTIDKIIVFCNTIATEGSAKLGYYPGSRDEKLLDSQIGNFLGSKLGDKIVVEMLINENKLILLPMSDIRGFDTTGMHAGIYITEAQNMNIDLMKLALQRVGQDSIMILDGDDTTQVDLGVYAGNNNGLRRVSQIFRGEDIYGEVTLKNIYRSKIADIAEKM